MITTAETYHVPVLLKESVDGLDIQPDGIYVDVTFGGGGHSKEILSRLGKKGHLYSFDQDADAEKNIVDDDRFTFVRSNFRYTSCRRASILSIAGSETPSPYSVGQSLLVTQISPRGTPLSLQNCFIARPTPRSSRYA